MPFPPLSLLEPKTVNWPAGKNKFPEGEERKRGRDFAGIRRRRRNAEKQREASEGEEEEGAEDMELRAWPRQEKKIPRQGMALSEGRRRKRGRNSQGRKVLNSQKEKGMERERGGEGYGYKDAVA